MPTGYEMFLVCFVLDKSSSSKFSASCSTVTGDLVSVVVVVVVVVVVFFHSTPQSVGCSENYVRESNFGMLSVCPLLCCSDGWHAECPSPTSVVLMGSCHS